jgi:hypothetical protein
MITAKTFLMQGTEGNQFFLNERNQLVVCPSDRDPLRKMGSSQ